MSKVPWFFRPRRIRPLDSSKILALDRNVYIINVKKRHDGEDGDDGEKLELLMGLSHRACVCSIRFT